MKGNINLKMVVKKEGVELLSSKYMEIIEI